MKAVKTLKAFGLKGKRVLYRAAYDVPLEKTAKGYRLRDDTRLTATIPTLKYLISQGCRTVIVTWCGRPEGKRVAKYSLQPVAQRLQKLLGHPVKFVNDCIGPRTDSAVAAMKPGEIILLENVRFHPEEDANDRLFGKTLSQYGEVLVFDAFAQAHRQVASIVGPPKYLPVVSGLLIEKELAILRRIMSKPKRPFVAVIGGAKIEDKLMLLKKLLRLADYILLGGVSANTILQIHGVQVGKSKVEAKMISAVRRLRLTDNKLKIPVDVVTATAISARAKTSLRPVGRVRPNERILDLGPETLKLYSSIIAQAGTVLWSGPMGYFELPQFSYGSRQIARAVAQSPGQTIIGGGDTIAAAELAGVLRKIDFVSTGGGAMLDFLSGVALPGLQYLHKK